MSELRVTAYYYASTHHLPCNLEYLAGLGLQAMRKARWEGIPEARVIEGPYRVHTWPERIWQETAGRGWSWRAEQVLTPEANRIPDPGANCCTGADGGNFPDADDYGGLPWDGDDIR